MKSSLFLFLSIVCCQFSRYFSALPDAPVKCCCRNAVVTDFLAEPGWLFDFAPPSTTFSDGDFSCFRLRSAHRLSFQRSHATFSVPLRSPAVLPAEPCHLLRYAPPAATFSGGDSFYFRLCSASQLSSRRSHATFSIFPCTGK